MSKKGRAETLKQIKGKRHVGLIVPMVLAIICMGVIFAYTTTVAKRDKEYNRLASELRLLSQTVSKYTVEASQGKQLRTESGRRTLDPFGLLRADWTTFKKSLNKIIEGDITSGMFAAERLPNGKFANPALQKIAVIARKFDKDINVILSNRKAVYAVNRDIGEITRLIPDLSADSHEVLSILVDNGARPAQIQKASIQLMLLERIDANVNKILVPHTELEKAGSKKGLRSSAQALTQSAVDRFSRDAVIFRNVVNGMLTGNKELGIQRVRDKEAIGYLKSIQKRFAIIGDKVRSLRKQFTAVSRVHKAAGDISANSNLLYKATTDLVRHYQGRTGFSQLLNYIAFASGALALVLLIMLGTRLVRDSRVRTRLAEAQNREQQEAILRLLDEIQGLSEGDLTAEAVVTEDFTGAIADAFNSTVEELRKLVTTINETSVQVSSAAQETQATAMHLAEASDHQAQQITAVGQAINDMARSIEEVSSNAMESTKVAQNSVKIAHAGVATVRRNIQGMDSIREQIQETSKRIKRLGESSQEIGDIIELINDIADQTNILSLNAAIQAAMAGEAGRGFAVVADEVQRLAERSSNATKQIEALVKTIQTDTNEAVISMEQSTAGVVKGAKMAEDAGEALAEIETVSNRLAELIQNISQSATQQSRVAAGVSETMNVIQEITTQTSAGTNETAASIGNLADLANDLRKSVAGFKLPEQR